MSGYETLLFIHVIGAFATVAGLSCVTPLVFEASVDEPASGRLLKSSQALFGMGGLLTLIFGLWLVSDRDYRFFKTWIIGALVLWLIAAGTGSVVKGPNDKPKYAIAVVSVVAVFILMIFKPGV
jgi:fucose permease